MTTTDSAIELVRSTPQLLAAIISPLPEDISTMPLDGGWSPKDVVAHLILTDRLSAFGRLKRLVNEDDPELPAFDEEHELAASGLRLQSTAALLAELTSERESNVRWLEKLQPSDLARSGRHSAVGAITGEELLFHAAYHDANHVRQLLAMIESVYEPLRGALRAY